jgi:N-methylhydantoinase A/oxoprolinase/acetone carboxylase beta subunit
MGGAFLTDNTNSIVIDMGGTTTDIALIKNNIPVKAQNGIHVGKWDTFVNGLYIKTIGLGGDTAIHYKNGKLFLEDYRVIPLCIAAEKHPSIIDTLKNLCRNIESHTRFLHEHFVLIKDISKDLTKSARYSSEEIKFCNALKERPLSLQEAATAVDKDIYTFDMSRLLREGIIQKCGLTPTDIMHIKNDFSRYPKEASILGAQFAASNLNIPVEDLCDIVYDEIKRRMYINIVEVLLENSPVKISNSEAINDFIDKSYDLAKNGIDNGLLTIMFQTNYTLVGIGAPIHIFLDDVAKMLGTKAVTPEHFEVANAIGTVVGNVYADFSVEIKPNYEPGGITSYTVFSRTENKTFVKEADAEAYAKGEAYKCARQEALNRGAKGDVTVEIKTNKGIGEARDSSIHLETVITAYAIGSISF